MNKRRTGAKLLAVLAGVSLVAAACGGDDSDDGGDDSAPEVTSGDTTAGGDTTTGGTDGGTDTTTGGTDGGTDTTTGGSDAPVEGAAGGELVDLGTFVGDPPEHIDPARNSTLDAYQVINALYDGLTDIDSSSGTPEIKPHVAESFESNEDASVWTFTIREGMAFSNGEEILPSTFKRSWERAAKIGGDYSYLMNFIEGGAEMLASEDNPEPATELSGVVADDEAMTLEVTLSAPYSNFPAVAGFQLFFPMPEEADAAPEDYENGVMIGNGPYMMESARTDEEIVLVKNDAWTGDVNGETWENRLDTITFRTSADPDTAYAAFEAGEGDTANLPPGRVTEAQENYATTLDVAILGSYHFDINLEDPVLGGEENKLLRQAISQAIDRDEINEVVYEGTRTTSTGITPDGIPGFAPDLCEYCAYDAEAAQAAFDDWTAAGGTLSEPIPINFNSGAGHEDVVTIIVDNLSAIGIEAVADPRDSETYFSDLATGTCTICRAGWFADYPTYDNFMYDLFHSDAIGGNNYSMMADPEFDALVDEAKQTVDPDEQATLFQDAERRLLNENIGVIPINWYLGDYVYNPETIANFPQTNFGLILWEQVALAG